MTRRQETGRRTASVRCPFLVEGTALGCGLAPFRKLVPGQAVAEHDQCCSSKTWRSCALIREHSASVDDDDRNEAVCPFLEETPVCSCAAASSSKLIPRTSTAVDRCLGDSHRYCDVFLENGARPAAAGIAVPRGLAIAQNHMWLDVGPDESCHVGVDAFLIRVLGTVDEVIFLSSCGVSSPSVALTVAGATLMLVFPQVLQITRVNRALQRHPGDLVTDPYGLGWLYEGGTIEPANRMTSSARAAGLRRGADAEAWMAAEVARLSRHVRSLDERRYGQVGPVAADGGEAATAFASHLDRAELLEIFSLFFV